MLSFHAVMSGLFLHGLSYAYRVAMIPSVTVNITKNLMFTDYDVSDICNAAYKILKMGAKAVLIKGGHFNDADMTDYLFNQSSDKPVEYKAHIINSPNTHGTGCTYSSAIASYLALGLDLNCAISKAKKYLTDALAAGADKCIGHGHGPVNHFYAPSPLKIHQL